MNNLRGARRKRILENPNVLRLTEKHIVFTDAFRAVALEKRSRGRYPDAIFEEAGFLLSDFKPNYFRYTLRKWVDQSNKPTAARRRGGRPKRPQNFETLEGLSEHQLRSIILAQQELIRVIKKKKALAKKR
jgi:hypothetical protein